MRRFKVMKQKLRNLSAPANIIFAGAERFYFHCTLAVERKSVGTDSGHGKGG